MTIWFFCVCQEIWCEEIFCKKKKVFQMMNIFWKEWKERRKRKYCYETQNSTFIIWYFFQYLLTLFFGKKIIIQAAKISWKEKEKNSFIRKLKLKLFYKGRKRRKKKCFLFIPANIQSTFLFHFVLVSSTLHTHTFSTREGPRPKLVYQYKIKVIFFSFQISMDRKFSIKIRKKKSRRKKCLLNFIHIARPVKYTSRYCSDSHKWSNFDTVTAWETNINHIEF
jgi:hypothetical protein